MIVRANRIASLLLGTILCGCASAPVSNTTLPDNVANLAPGLTCAIPPPSAAGGNVSAAQTIIVHFHDRTFSLQTQIQITPGRLDLVALDNMGRRAMTVSLQGSHIDYTRAQWFPVTVRPADILEDIAIVQWPADAIASSLSACGVTLTATANGRDVKSGNRDLVAVTYEKGEGWNRGAHLRNLAFGFSIDIQSVDLAQ
jgi:hypothetical protein